MDPLTHILMGATTAQLGFRQRLGRGATWAAIVATVVPDLDVLAGPVLRAVGADLDGGNPWAIHRGLSHSLLVAPILALPIAAAWWKLRRRRARRETADAISDVPGNGVPRPVLSGRAATRKPEERREETRRGTLPSPASFRLLYACVLVAGLTHPLLDWGTAYGTQILAPITATRYAASFLPIIDIFFTPMLALTLLACWLARKSSFGEARRATLVIGWAGFLLSIGYLVAGAVLHDRAANLARALAGGTRIVRAEAYPALGSIFVWRAVIETDKQWIAARIRPLASAAPRHESAARQGSAWTERARELPEVRSYLSFATGLVRAAESERDGLHVVELHDMRYGLRPESIESLWPLQVTFDKEGNVLPVESHPPHLAGNRWRLVKETWADLWEP